MVHCLSSGKAAVAEKHPVPVHHIVIHMVMAHKGSHHVTGFQHGCKQPRIESRCTCLFLARAYQQSLFILSCLVVFGKRYMEKCQGRQRLPSVPVRIPCALSAEPFHLLGLDPVISLHILPPGIRMTVKYIHHCGIFRPVRRADRKDIVCHSRKAFHRTGQVIRLRLDVVAQLLSGHALLVIMVAPCYGKGYIPRNDRLKCLVKPFGCGTSINQVARIDDKIGFFCLQHFIHAHGRLLACRIAGHPVNVCKLHDLELSVASETKLLRKQAASHTAQGNQTNKSIFHNKTGFLMNYQTISGQK